MKNYSALALSIILKKRSHGIKKEAGVTSDGQSVSVYTIIDTFGVAVGYTDEKTFEKMLKKNDICGAANADIYISVYRQDLFNAFI